MVELGPQFAGGRAPDPQPPAAEVEPREVRVHEAGAAAAHEDRLEQAIAVLESPVVRGHRCGRDSIYPAAE
jgi:hypothetical protein